MQRRAQFGHSPVAVIGIDASSKKLAAVATWLDATGPRPQIWKRTLVGKTIESRCYNAYRWARWLVGDLSKWCYQNEQPFPFVYTFIEEPVVVPRNIKSTLLQAKVHGALVASLKAHKTNALGPIQTVVPPAWKKDVVGHGHATKPQVARHVEKHWPYLYTLADKDQDLLDAACINIYGTHWIRKNVRAAEPITEAS